MKPGTDRHDPPSDQRCDDDLSGTLEFRFDPGIAKLMLIIFGGIFISGLCGAVAVTSRVVGVMGETGLSFLDALDHWMYATFAGSSGVIHDDELLAIYIFPWTIPFFGWAAYRILRRNRVGDVALRLTDTGFEIRRYFSKTFDSVAWDDVVAMKIARIEGPEVIEIVAARRGGRRRGWPSRKGNDVITISGRGVTIDNDRLYRMFDARWRAATGRVADETFPIE